MKPITVRQVQRFAAHGIDTIPDAVAAILFPSWQAPYGRCATYVRHGVVGGLPIVLTVIIDRYGRVMWRTTIPEALPARVQKQTLRQLADSCAARYGADERWYDAIIRLLDDLISTCDNRAQSRAVKRPKATNDVDGTRQDGDVTHGGDGASGETTSPAAGPSRHAAMQDDATGDDPLDEVDRRLAQMMRCADERQRLHIGHRGRGGFGRSDSGARLATTRRTVVEECRQALVRLIEHDSDDIEGPRWSATQLARRLVTHQPLAPARRHEMGRPAVLVIADVSGSCSSFAEPACAVANACGACGIPGADVLVLSITNPLRPIEFQVNGKHIPLPDNLAERPVSVEQLTEMFAWNGWRVPVIIHLGDEQECDSIEAWARHPDINRVIWLDNYLSSQECPTFKEHRTRRLFPNASVREKLCHVIACGTARDMATGLTLAVDRRP